MNLRHFIAGLAFTGLLAGAAAALAVDVTVVGLFPSKALVQIDGAPPRILSVNQKTLEGVTLLSVERDAATFDIAGRRRTLKLGQAVSTSGSSGRQSTTLAANSQGHFLAAGQINGAMVNFVVDTGATLVALSSGEARRIGLSYLNGDPTVVGTANGMAKAFRVKLDTVRVGDITVNAVDAVVMENQNMPVLLGMSFLNRMDMKRDGQTMVLTKRF